MVLDILVGEGDVITILVVRHWYRLRKNWPTSTVDLGNSALKPFFQFGEMFAKRLEWAIEQVHKMTDLLLRNCIPINELAQDALDLVRCEIRVKKMKRIKRTAKTWEILQDINALNEQILEAADKIHGESLAPEVSAGTAEITVWDQSPEDVGWRAHEPADGQLSDDLGATSV